MAAEPDHPFANTTPEGKGQHAHDYRLEDIPLRTRREFESAVDIFSQALLERAFQLMQQRQSSTLTDADVADANRDLRRKATSSKARRCMGVALLIAGGVFLPLGNVHVLLSVAGVIMCGAGLFVREWLDG